MKRFFLGIFFVGGLASLLLAVLISCGEDAGLGSSIDTKAPVLSITYPDSGAAIRDSFILAGDCSDDKSISRILVSVKNLESGVDYGSYPAKLSADQTSWQVTLNEYDSNNAAYYNGWQLPDGKYEVSVTAYDNAGNNSGVSSRQFELDNTPPVFIISNPGVVKSSGLKASAYGSLFTIDGTISDNHPISYMDVKIFRTSDGQLLSHETYEGSAIDFYREEDIATAGGSSVTIAQWSDTATQTAKTRYTDIYGDNEEAGTIEYFAQIALYDSAKVYKNPPKNSSRSAVEVAADVYGNSTSTVYLYDDVYTALMSAKKGLGLSAANLKDILAGLDKGEKATAALSTLSTNAKNTEVDANRLYFSLNPQANPTYTVNGYKFNFVSNENQLASSGNTVSVTVSAGLDGTNIQPDLVKVWIKKYASKPTDEIAVKSELEKLNQKVIELTKEEAEFVEDVTTINLESGNDWILVYDYAQHNDKGSSVPTKTFAVTLPAIEDYIELEKFYILGVTGHDVDEVRFSQNIVYGFEGNAAGVPPTFAFDDTEGSETPKSLSIWKNFEDPQFSGTATVSTGSYYVKEITATLTLKDESDNSEIGKYTDTMTSDKNSDGEVVWTKSSESAALSWDTAENKWKIDLTKLPGLSSVYISNKQLLASLEISGKSSSGHSGSTSRDIHIDTVAPVVTMTSITPSVSGSEYFGNDDTNTYLNGNITIKGNVEEQNLKNVSYDIWASTDLGKTLDEGDSILEDLKTRKTELGLDAGAADGNFDGSLGKQFTLNIPFATTAITKLFHVYKGAEEDAKIQVELVVTAEDEAGNKGSYSSKTLNGSKNFVIYQETDRPKITLGNADAAVTSADGINVDTNLFGTTNNNKLQISFEDDDSIAEYKIILYKEDGTQAALNDVYGSGTNEWTAQPKKTTASINYLLPEEEGKYQVKIEAKDYISTDLNTNPYGEKSVGNFFVAVDSGAPNITITKPVAGSYQNGTVQVEGTVSKYVDVTITGKLLREDKSEVTGNGTSVSQVTIDSTPTNGVYKWTGTMNLPTNASGSYLLSYTAEDGYGQKTSTQVGFVVDITPPKFNITVPAETEVFTADSMYTVKGTISDGDSTSGIKGLYWSITPQTASENYEPLSASGALNPGWNQIAATPTATKGEYTWIANIELPTDVNNGTAPKTVCICVIDEAGNISKISENAKSNSLKITLDQVSPETTLLGTGLKKPVSAVASSETGAKDDAGNLPLAADSELSESISYYATDSTNGYKISGVVTETSGVTNVSVKVDGTEVSLDSTTGKWTFNGKTTDGTYTHQIVITDKAGNSVTKKVSVIRDTAKPVLTVSNDTNDNDALNGSKVITENNANYSNSDGVHYYLLSGKWKDLTSGTYKLQYRVAPKHEGDTYSDTWSDWRDVSDVTQSTAETSWSVKVPMTEGKGLGSGVALQGRAIDAAGNVFEHEGHSGLKLDFSVPTIAAGSVKKNNTVVTDYKYVKEGETLVIEGTCADSYALDEINVVAKKDGTAVSTGTNGLVIENVVTDGKKSGTFKITLTAGSTNNGKWEFEVKAKDWVERESQTLKFSTLVDTVKPEWNDSDILVDKKTYIEGTNHSWYKNSTLPFSGSLTENGSGIKEIRYTITKADGTAADSDSFTTSLVKDASGNVEKETFSTKLGEFLSKKDESGVAQANTVTLVAEDEAGNVSAQKTFKIYIDSESPQLLSTDKSGNQYSNKSNSITVNGQASDDASGVDSVKLSITVDGSSTPLTISGSSTEITATSTDSFANWTATIPKDFLSGLEDKTYAVKATLTDKAGNSSNSTIFRIDVDTDKPVIKNVSLSDGGGTYSVYETKEKIDGADKTVYYIHSGDNFLLSGSVQDSKSGIKSIVVNDGTNDIVSQIDGKDVTALPVTLDLSSYASAGSVTLKITATDNAGNTESQNVLVKIDNIAPKALHAIDEKNKDVFFRINENDNDDIETLTELDKDVGGKYSEGTYGNSKTIKIRGTLSDTGSGAAMIYYKVISETDLAGVAESDLQEKLNEKSEAFLQNYKTDKTGYFAPGVIASDAKRRVFYTGSLKNALGESTSFNTTSGEYKDFVSSLGTLSGNTKSYATVESNYNSVLSGFSTGKNYLILVAVDNVGNAALDSVKVGGTTYNNISLNVDETTPDASSSVEGLKYTNKNGTMEFSGTASDADSGLYSIKLKQGTKEILLKNDAADGTSTNENGTLTIEKTDGKDNEWTWTATVNSDKFFADASGTVSVSLEAKDRAGIGNTKSINVATVIVDEQLDSITLSSPTDADSETAGTQVNGIITLTGTMEDKNVLPANAITRIEYKGGDASDWADLSTKVDSLALSGSYTFTVEGFDTTKLSDNTEYQLRVVGTDSAGNEKASDAVSVKVSQDSDRPIFKITNITDLGATADPRFALKYGTQSQLSATVTDDDGVEDVVLSEEEFTGAEDTDGTPTETAKGHTDFTNDSVKFKPSRDYAEKKNIDGRKTVYIYIKDKAGKKFYTSYTYTPEAGTQETETVVNAKTLLSRPKIRVGETKFDTDLTSLTSPFQYTSDSNAPSVAEISALAYKSDGTVNGGAQKTADGTSDALDANGNKIYDQFETITASYTLGGTEKQKTQFRIAAYDASDIDGITLEVSYKKTTGTGTSKTTQTVTDKYVSPNFTVDGYTSNGTKEEKQFGVNGENYPGMVWTTDIISFEEADSGSVSIKIVPYDKLSLPGSGNAAFAVDNSGPEIKVSNPLSEDEVTGTISFIGTALDAGSATYDTKWLIPTKAQQLPTVTDAALYALTTWKDTGFTSKSTASSWTFELKSNDLTDYDDATTYAQSASNGIYVIPFYIMSKDSLGNYSIKRDYTFKHNPDADRPRTTISYPEVKKNSDGSIEAPILGGTIRVAGDAIIPQGEATVKAVYLQVGTISSDGTPVFNKYSHNSGKLISDPVTKVGDVNNGGYGYTVKTLDEVRTELGFTSLNFAASNSSADWWGIPVEKTGSSWHFNINANGEMNPADGEQTHLALRAIAINSDGKVGAWTATVIVDIDATAPKQTVSLRRYSTSISAANADSMKDVASAAAVKVYESGIYLKDDWYFTVQLDDESSLEEFSVKKGNEILNCGTDYFASNLENLTGGAKRQYLFIPVDRSKETVSYTVSVTDTKVTGGHTIDKTYNLNIDNTAPEIQKLYRGSSSDSTDLLENDYEIADSDYIFQMGGKVSEEGSGLDRVVFYYVREGEGYGKQAVLDPLITTGTGDAKARIYNAKSNTDDSDDTSSPILTKREIKQTVNGTENTYHLWSLAVTGTMKAYEFTSTTSLADNKHIRKGGLIEIAGVYRKINKVEGNTVTFDTSTGLEADVTSQTTAYFPYAQCVDNTNLEKVSNTSVNPFTFSDDSDDGDGMPEELGGAKSTGFTWNSTIHSTNIPDGPAKLVILAFDKAGNVTGREFTVKIVNSAPRLAKVFLGTDLNSNNVWSKDEFVGYNLYNANAAAGIGTTEVKDKLSIATASFEGNKKFSVKDKLAVISEFVGGNGDITLVYKKGAEVSADALPAAVPSTGTGAGTVAASNATISSTQAALITTLIGTDERVEKVTYNNRSNVATSLRGFTLTSKQVAGLANTETLTAANGNKETEQASFTFWDSTEETTPGVNSQNCVLHIKDLNLALVDATKPEAKIRPFHWASKDDNSLYENNGHIELEKDLPTTTFLAATESGEYDRDPKVSGKIILTGTAYDNKMLKQIQMKMTGFNFGTTAGAYEVMDTFTVTESGSSWGTSENGTHKGSLASNGYEFFINESSLDQSGHKVIWTLYLDTSFVAGTAANDRVLIVQTVDASGSNTTQNSTEGTKNTVWTYNENGTLKEDDETGFTSYYRLDVVPYITGIETQVTKYAGAEFGRAASGAYSVYYDADARAGEKITINGFNLISGTTKPTVKVGNKTLTVANGEYDKSSIKATIGSDTVSGNLSVQVATGLVTLNNENASPAIAAGAANMSDENGHYNSHANGKNNNRLTDDVELAVWELGNFVNTADITSPMMKMSTGSDWYMSYGYGVPSMYVNKNGITTQVDYSYNKFHNTNVAFDASGNIYAVATNTDRVGNNSAKFSLYSRTVSADDTDTNYQGSWTGKSLLEYVYNGDTGIYNINRVQRPKIAVSGKTESAKIFIGYYDSNNAAKPVKVRYGTIGNNNLFNDGSLTTGWYGNVSDNNNHYDYYQTVADKDSTHKGGEYTAVGFVPSGTGGAASDVGVVAWYDAENSCLVYSYCENPANGTKNTWQNNAIVLDSDYAGWYVDMAVDAGGGIHIAYYTTGSGDLKYAYLPMYNSPLADAKVVTVDSYLSTGTQISINTRNDGTAASPNYVPYISYYNGSLDQTKNSVRVAWRTSSTVQNGTDSDKATGNWQFMSVPCSSVPDNAVVCNGVPTDGTYANKVVLGFKTDKKYVRAVLK